MGYEFELQPGVVIPRSPIGYLLEDWPLSLQSRALADKTRVGRIVDLCSGSGCLGIIAAHSFPNAEVTLVELDAQAAELARRNVSTRSGVAGAGARGRCGSGIGRIACGLGSYC